MTDIETPAPDGETHEPVEEPQTPDLAAEVAKWKEFARRNEARAKENAEKAKRLDELEEASKSEQQKLSEAAAQAREEASATAVELAQLRAAVKHGLSDEDLDLLGSGTPEEIDARAERLAARIKGVTPVAPNPSGQGKPGEPVTNQSEEADLEAAIQAAIKARNIPLSVTLKQQLAAIKQKKG